MSHDRDSKRGPDAESASPSALEVSPGKRTSTQRLAQPHGAGAVQRRARFAMPPQPTAEGAPSAGVANDPFGLHQADRSTVQRQASAPIDGADVHAHAQRGVEGAAQPLPHGAAIQAAFGHHDVGGVRAHVGGAAAEAATAIGASAYATGHDVAFASAPDLHTAAHEAAHVVQQRSGVHLKGGVGQAGDVYERHADAVADAVVRGESAADLLGPVAAGHAAPAVQRQADDQAPLPPVAVTVTWSSPFGNDLTGQVVLFGRNPSDDDWTRLASLPVAGAHAVTFEAMRHFARYRASVQPDDDQKARDDADDGPFNDTEMSSPAVPASATAVTIRGRLDLNRWNPENVKKRHESHNIDPGKAKDLVIEPLFGRVVQVHRKLVPRVQRTNAMYEALDPDTKQEISRNLFVTGGYAYRNITGPEGGFTNHSVGAAIDINYNEGHLQNALMETTPELAVLNDLVVPVVRMAPGFGDFDVWSDKGQRQLEAAHVFVEVLPGYLAQLLGRDEDAARVSEGGGFNPLREMGRVFFVHLMFDDITPAELRRAAAHEPDRTKRRHLELLADNWASVKAWVVGAEVTDQHAGQKDPRDAHLPRRKQRDLPDEKKTAQTMIPLDRRVLQLMLDAGWKWGGDWGAGRKDYMHFEDESFIDDLRLDSDEHH